MGPKATVSCGGKGGVMCRCGVDRIYLPCCLGHFRLGALPDHMADDDRLSACRNNRTNFQAERIPGLLSSYDPGNEANDWWISSFNEIRRRATRRIIPDRRNRLGMACRQHLQVPANPLIYTRRVAERTCFLQE